MALFLACVVLNSPENEVENGGVFLAAAAGWAVTVAFSRCVMGRHYLSDVIAGLLLGVLTVALVTQVRPSKRAIRHKLFKTDGDDDGFLILKFSCLFFCRESFLSKVWCCLKSW